MTEKDDLAADVVRSWREFEAVTTRAFPREKFRRFSLAARMYATAAAHDGLAHLQVLRIIHNLNVALDARQGRVPQGVLWEAERLDCLFFLGYDPHFEGHEPPGR